jgi:hypothetical protein
MLLPSHIKSATQGCGSYLDTSHSSSSQWLVRLAYVDDETKEGNEVDKRMDSITVILSHDEWICVGWYSCYALL